MLRREGRGTEAPLASLNRPATSQPQLRIANALEYGSKPPDVHKSVRKPLEGFSKAVLLWIRRGLKKPQRGCHRVRQVAEIDSDNFESRRGARR